MREQAIAPGADAYGHLLFELPSIIDAAFPVTLTIDAGGEQFRFALLLRPVSD